MNKYLIELISNHDSVIIPKFGALMVTSTKSRKMMFNQHLKFNDGKFVDFVANKEGISKLDATNKVEEYAFSILSTVETGEPFVVEGLGSFMKSRSGDIEFLQFQEKTVPSQTGEKAEVKPEKATIIPELPKKKKAPKKDLDAILGKEKAVIKGDKKKVVPITPKVTEAKKEVKADNKKVEKEVKAETEKKDSPVSPKITEPKKEHKAEPKKVEKEINKVTEKKITPVSPKITEAKKEVKVETKKAEKEVKKKVEKKIAPINTNTTKVKEELKTLKEELKDEKKTVVAASRIDATKHVAPNKENSVTPPASVEPTEKKKRFPWWIAAILVIALGVGGYFVGDSMGWFSKSETAIAQNKEDKENKPEGNKSETEVENNVIEPETIEKDTTSSTIENIENTDDIEPEEAVVEATPEPEPIVEEKPEPVVQTPVNNGNYHIIVGAFGNENNADKLVVKLQEKGLNASKLEKRGGLYRVSAGSYDSVESAKADKQRINYITGKSCGISRLK